MTGLASRVDAVLAGWVHSRVADADGRTRQIADFRHALLCALVLLFVLPVLLLSAFPAMVTLAFGAGCAALPLVVASVLSGTGSRGAAGAVALLLASAAIAALAGSSGGISSPFAVWAGVLPLAAAIAGRTWRWSAAGLAAGVAGCGLAMLVAAPASAGPGIAFAAGLPLAVGAAYALARLSIAVERRRSGAQAAQQAELQAVHVPLDRLPGLVTLHDLKGNVLEVHGLDAAACGKWLRQPLGRGFYQHIHVADRLFFMQAVDRIRQGERSASLELRMHDLHSDPKDEQFVHLHVDLAAIAGRAGTPLILAQSRDVSARVAAAERLAGMAESAEKANVAKTRFLTAVSHELRTPLNAILGFSDVLAQEYFGSFESEKQREYVELIRQSGDHLLSLVNSMLDMSRIAAGRYELSPETFSPADAVRRCESMLALQARRGGVLLTSRISRDCGELTADRRAVDQILINLVANAIKFTEKGGVVTVDVERHRDRLRLSVSDTGIGISAENLDLIGEPFVQVEADPVCSGKGTGLGLSLVKGLVSLHGGAFTISSVLGEGTVVCVELPSDGSGVAREGASHRATMIEFPPRLPAEPTEDGESETDGIDDAQAKTA